ncbi:MAG TPA: hypothetical protein VKZ53_05310 [Candidatus Angelobacter sp.]|nr:hypothetical protein [Candidatus Angelobacter sp.]
MSGTKQTVAITSLGVGNPTVVQIQDTVVWQVEDSLIKTATITFTGSDPFNQSVSSSITLSNGQKSSGYVVRNAAENGAYPYTVVESLVNGGISSFSCNIKVVADGTKLPGTGGLVG